MAANLEATAVSLSIGYEFYALAARDEQIRHSLRAHFAAYRTLLQSIIAKGIERGEFKPVDANVVAVSVLALFEGINVLWYTSPDENDWAVICTQSMQLLLDSISL